VQFITEHFHAWLQAAMTSTGVYQLVIIIIALIVSILVHKRWRAFVMHRLGETEREGLKRFALRSSALVVFPLMMWVVIAVGRGILSQLRVNTPLLDILVPLLLSLAVVRFVVFALRRAYRPSPLLKAMENVIAGIIWSGVALYLLGWLPDVIKALDSISMNLGDARISLFSILKFFLTATLFVVAARWILQWIEHKTRSSAALSATMQVGLAKFSAVVLYTLAILIALDAVGINLTALAVFGGAIGVGVGFGLQRITSNFISGFILLFDRSIKPGDVISVRDQFGWVVALHARYIVVRDRDGVETLIPNENLITSEVTNWSYSDRNVRIKLPVSISYSDDPELAMELMVKAAEVSKRVLPNPAPVARLVAFGDNGIELELRLWIEDPEMGTNNVRSEVNVAIWKAFNEAGITIPFPQRDVYVKQLASQTKAADASAPPDSVTPVS
jgi:small-conductance mechanosensitive channel